VPLPTDPPAGDHDTLLHTLTDLHRSEQTLAAAVERRLGWDGEGM
jgi:hypothetical protein